LLEIILAFAILSLCFVRFSSVGRDGPDRAVEGKDYSPLVHDACTPVDNPRSDMNLSVINSVKTSLASFSAVLNASNICTWDKQFVGSGNDSEHGNEIENESTMITV
jgi:hypothetical protein